MERRILLDQLEAHRNLWLDGNLSNGYRKRDQDIYSRVKDFINREKGCFNNTNEAGTITGSALVVSPSFKKVILCFHGRLDRWLQLGGHSDGDGRTHLVAQKEAQEETGVSETVSFVNYEKKLNSRNDVVVPFDLAIHEMPKEGGSGKYTLYDIRYLLKISTDIPLIGSEESYNIKWFSMKEARQITDEIDVIRMLDKVKVIEKILA